MPRLRGRPCREVSIAEHLHVQMLLEQTGPRLGLPTLQHYCPATPRCVLAHLLKTHRRQFQAKNRLVVESLTWHQPGAVWAIDHAEPPRPIDGRYQQILAVRDLASGRQLAWTPVRDSSTDEALAVLEALARQHGPPLVLKSDNGSAFISQRMSRWLAAWKVVSLLSPVRMPRYNGACEAGIGGLKRRTEQIAARHNAHLDWTCDDLYAALHGANHDHYPRGLAAGTPADRFAARAAITAAQRDIFQAAVIQYQADIQRELFAHNQPRTKMLTAIIHRRAVRRALVEHHQLSITRRAIPLPIKLTKRATIT